MDISRIQNHPAGVALATRYDKSKDREGEFDKFVAVSVALTGFSDAEFTRPDWCGPISRKWR